MATKAKPFKILAFGTSIHLFLPKCMEVQAYDYQPIGSDPRKRRTPCLASDAIHNDERGQAKRRKTSDDGRDTAYVNFSLRCRSSYNEHQVALLQTAASDEARARQAEREEKDALIQKLSDELTRTKQELTCRDSDLERLKKASSDFEVRAKAEAAEYQRNIEERFAEKDQELQTVQAQAQQLSDQASAAKNAFESQLNLFRGQAEQLRARALELPTAQVFDKDTEMAEGDEIVEATVEATFESIGNKMDAVARCNRVLQDELDSRGREVEKITRRHREGAARAGKLEARKNALERERDGLKQELQQLRRQFAERRKLSKRTVSSKTAPLRPSSSTLTANPRPMTPQNLDRPSWQSNKHAVSSGIQKRRSDKAQHKSVPGKGKAINKYTDRISRIVEHIDRQYRLDIPESSDNGTSDESSENEEDLALIRHRFRKISYEESVKSFEEGRFEDISERLILNAEGTKGIVPLMVNGEAVEILFFKEADFAPESETRLLPIDLTTEGVGDRNFKMMVCLAQHRALQMEAAEELLDAKLYESFCKRLKRDGTHQLRAARMRRDPQSSFIDEPLFDKNFTIDYGIPETKRDAREQWEVVKDGLIRMPKFKNACQFYAQGEECKKPACWPPSFIDLEKQELCTKYNSIEEKEARNEYRTPVSSETCREMNREMAKLCAQLSQ